MNPAHPQRTTPATTTIRSYSFDDQVTSERVEMHFLLRPEPPWVYAAGARDEGERESFRELLSRNPSVVHLDCTTMTTVDDLFDVFAERLAFPDYFGRNWPAFSECLSEVNEWLSVESLVLVFDNARSLLSADIPDIPAFFRAVESAAETLAVEIRRGEAWDRPSVPLHAVLIPGLNASLVGYELPVLERASENQNIYLPEKPGWHTSESG